MRGVKILAGLAAGAVTAALLPALASAQFGLYNIPQNDFTWVWGRGGERQRRGFADFNVKARDSGFDCTLQGSLHPSGNFSTTQVRGMENELRQSLFFIEQAANTMHNLDLRRDIDWAELACVKFVENASEAELREREEKARAKAERARERRRERESRDD